MRVAIACLLMDWPSDPPGPGRSGSPCPPDHAYARPKSGPGSDVTQTQCQFCHSTDYIVMQPRGDAKQWDGGRFDDHGTAPADMKQT
jgi:cytochrome c5